MDIFSTQLYLLSQVLSMNGVRNNTHVRESLISVSSITGYMPEEILSGLQTRHELKDYQLAPNTTINGRSMCQKGELTYARRLLFWGLQQYGYTATQIAGFLAVERSMVSKGLAWIADNIKGPIEYVGLNIKELEELHAKATAA